MVLIGGCSRDTNPGARTGIDLDVLSPLSPSSLGGCSPPRSPAYLFPTPPSPSAGSTAQILALDWWPPSMNPFFFLSLSDEVEPRKQ